jgi:hypothetical protein
MMSMNAVILYVGCVEHVYHTSPKQARIFPRKGNEPYEK